VSATAVRAPRLNHRLATGSGRPALLCDRPCASTSRDTPGDWVTLTRTLRSPGSRAIRRLVRPADVDDSAGHPFLRRAGPRRVDGRWAPDRPRHPAGARIDGEATPSSSCCSWHRRGPGLRRWVLVIGAARDALLLRLADPVAGARCRPGSGQVVAAVQGSCFTVAASGLPRPLTGMYRCRRRIAAAGRSRSGRDVIWLSGPARAPAPAGSCGLAITGSFGACSCGVFSSRPTWFPAHPPCLVPHPRGMGLGLVAVAVCPAWPRQIVPPSLESCSPCSRHHDARHSVPPRRSGMRSTRCSTVLHLPGHRAWYRHDRRTLTNHLARRGLARLIPGRPRDPASAIHITTVARGSPRRGSRPSPPSSGLGAVRGPVTQLVQEPRSPRPAPQASRRAGARHPDSARATSAFSSRPSAAPT